MKKTVLIFGILAFAIIALLQLSKYAIISGSMQTEWILGIVAFIFLGAGILLQKRKWIFSDHDIVQVDEDRIQSLGLSKREYEVLVEMAAGFSNKEIATHLFVSESTIKTHVSNVLLKLDAKRRTQAIQLAKAHKILPIP